MPQFNDNLTLVNGAGVATVSASNSTATLRLGGGGNAGEMFVRNGAGDNVATIDGDTGDLVLGGNGVTGDVFLRDAAGGQRVRLQANGQRIEVLDAAGNIVGMLGGGGNIRAGTNGEDGDLFLYRAAAGDIFADGQATVRLSAGGGDLRLGGNGVAGDVFLDDAAGTNRVVVSSAGQRIEVKNAAGAIVGMLGGGGNIRAGTNGEDGDLFLYRAAAGDIFADGEATVRLNGANADLTLGGNRVGGDIFLNDEGGTNRVFVSAANQRIEVKDRLGRIIGMLGGAGNIRAGSNGENGEVHLYPSSATDIFNNGQATIHLDANAGDITLRNADMAEDFDIAAAVAVEPGTVMRLDAAGCLVPCDAVGDTRAVGVISGAGGTRPGMILDRRPEAPGRAPVALLGKVGVKVDAREAAIAPGDLLTTAALPGHARKAGPDTPQGAILGKALSALAGGGTGEILMLVYML